MMNMALKKTRRGFLPQMHRGLLAAVVAVTVGVALADHVMLIEMMDISREEGKTPAKTGAVRTCGKIHWRSLNVVVPSRVTIPLGGNAVNFIAVPGVADDSKSEGLSFKVLDPDGRVLWEKVDVKKGDKASVYAKMRGLEKVILEVAGPEGAKGAWAEASFKFEVGKYPPNDVRVNSRQLGILTPKTSAVPRINGATVLGVRPGHPILFKVPVTGAQPLKVEVEKVGRVEKLSGLNFNPATRILSGKIDEPGEYKLVFRASNAEGQAERDFTIKVGETISLTPAMGWNSWNCFASGVTAEKVKAAADALVASGLSDHGWQYVNIDDYWENNEKKGQEDVTLRGPARFPDGTIATNRRFPDMKGLADYVHAKGLKIGLYSSPGPTTCGGCTGSWQHEEQDAKTYADWGFDFLKYDWCSYGSVAMGSGLRRAMYPYLVMGRALRMQNRDILFSLCQYGMENVSAWGFEVGGSSWRTTGDVFDSWKSISDSIERQKQLWYYSKPGAWNDPDMLCVGKMKWNQFAGSRLAPNEQYTHISLWALVASPLMIGCDMTDLDDFTFSLLSNDEVIEIDQDPLGKGAACIFEDKVAEYEIWARPLADGSVAVGLYNKSVKEQVIPFDLEKTGLLCKWKVRDVWRQEDVGVFLGKYESSVPGHATELLRLSPLACGKFRDGMTDIRENAWMNEVERLTKNKGDRPSGIPVK